MTVDISKLPELPAGLYYASSTDADAKYVWVRPRGIAAPLKAAWCIDCYEKDGVVKWRLESEVGGWNAPYNGLEGYKSMEEACEVLYRYITVLGVKHYD